MKRDDEFIRELLFEFEASNDLYLIAHVSQSASDDDKKRYLHAELLCDAGFFEAVNKGLYRMTNQGYDYLEVIRDNSIWEKTKSGAELIGGATLGILKELAVAYAKDAAKTKLGIDLG
ncbi:MAG: DUF2513 domain-containing protein [Hyphomicrobiales bacterium]